jgi:hypothetical protein
MLVSGQLRPVTKQRSVIASLGGGTVESYAEEVHEISKEEPEAPVF